MQSQASLYGCRISSVVPHSQVTGWPNSTKPGRASSGKRGKHGPYVVWHSGGHAFATSLHVPSLSSRDFCASTESMIDGSGYSPNTASYSALYLSMRRHATRMRLPLTDT